jgi:hypothetical protein
LLLLATGARESDHHENGDQKREFFHRCLFLLRFGACCRARGDSNRWEMAEREGFEPSRRV